jgi:hypothetical protein
MILELCYTDIFLGLTDIISYSDEREGNNRPWHEFEIVCNE